MDIVILILEIKDMSGLKKMKYQFDFMMQKQMMLFGMLLQDSKDQVISMIKLA